MNLHFRTWNKSCPECHAPLKPYKTVRRTVRSIDMGEFTAVEHLKICRAHDKMKVFGSDHLKEIVGAYCTYANDVMARSAGDRFISGRSSSEISASMDNGISASHIRYLSNIALKIHGDVHRNNPDKIKKYIGSYVLGIDGTPDPDFSMIIGAMDHRSGFTLFSERCDSESDESIRSILIKIKERFGVPSGYISDMRAGMVSALESVFPDTPGRVCWFHFLRALGTDLMKDLHTDMGLMIRRIGIGSCIKRYIRELPEAELDILEFVESGYSPDPDRIALFAVRSILEKILPGASSMGFPFGLRHLVFYNRIRESVTEIGKILEKTGKDENADLIRNVISLLERISCNPDLAEMADKLEGINSLFMELRKSMNVPNDGDLSVQFREDDAHERSSIFVETLRVYTAVNIPNHLLAASKRIIGQYDKWEKNLFANNAEHTIPTTNNGMERSFRKVRRNIRKRCGNRATSAYLKKNAEELLLYQNMDIPEYRNVLYGNDEMIPVIFGRNRSKFTQNHGISRKRVDELARIGKDKLISGELTDKPYDAALQPASKNMG